MDVKAVHVRLRTDQVEYQTRWIELPSLHTCNQRRNVSTKHHKNKLVRLEIYIIKPIRTNQECTRNNTLSLCF